MTTERRFHLLACIGYTMTCMAWTVWAGLDQSWDQLHYHIYVAHAWWENRLPDELFAASSQSYLNPLPHLPFYAVYRSGAHGLVIGLTMALLHSTNLWLLHFISCRLIPPVDRMGRFAVACSVLLGALSPAFLVETGTSYTDVIASIPALGALLILLAWHGRPLHISTNWTPLYIAGLLAGMSMGLKPSTLVFCAALALALVVLAGKGAWSIGWRATLAGLAGLAMTGGPHAWMLWKTFGNPVFPLFNGYFQSPWFPPVNVVADRFRPTSIEAALRYPIDMANPFKKVGFEGIAMDIRPAWLIGLLAVTGAVWFFRRQRAPQRQELNPQRQLFWLTLILFIPGWLYTSGNIRYALPSFLFFGPAICMQAIKFVAKRSYFPLAAIIIPLFGQTAFATTLNLQRFDGNPWRQNWLSLALPKPLDQNPAYYVSLQMQSFASFAPLFPPQSRFMNFIGQNTLSPTSPVLRQLEYILKTTGLPLRSLYEAYTTEDGLHVSPVHIRTQNALLSEYGYQTRQDKCVLIEQDPNASPPLTWSKDENTGMAIGGHNRGVIISCALEKAPPLPADEKTRRANIDARIDHWSRQCPAIFSPEKMASEQSLQGRRRFFPNTDVSISEARGQLILNNGPLIYLEKQDGTQLVTTCPQRPSR